MIVRLIDQHEAARLLKYLETHGISRRAVRETIRHDQRMARELLGTALVEMREVETRQVKKHQNGGGLL